MDSRTLVSWTGVLSATGVFVVWTLTSFLCHEFSKKFLLNSETLLVSDDDPQDQGLLSVYRLFAAVVLTTVQCCSCLLLTQTDEKMRQSRAMTIILTSHALASLVTNYSMVFIEAASTLAIKLMEPITMAVAHHVVFQKRVSIQTFISIPLVIYGSLIFTGVKFNRMSDTAGVSLAFASNTILAARNITLKKMLQESNTHSWLALRTCSHITLVIYLQGLLVAGMFVLAEQGLTSKCGTMFVALALASGIYHVAYSYISTNIVLNVMNVVSHSIANIFKRLLVVLLLSALGTRELSASNYLGLGIALAGLLVYTHGKIGADQQSCKYVKVSEDGPLEGQKHKTCFVVLLLLAFSLVIFVHSTSVHLWTNISLSSARHDCYSHKDLGINSLHETRRPRNDFEIHSLHENIILKEDMKFNVHNGLQTFRETHEDLKFQSLKEVTELNGRFSQIIEAETDPEMKNFLSRRLVDHPEDTDKRSKTLTTNKEIVEEAQRILVNLMEDLLGKARHVMLIDIPVQENKGDPAIAAGEVLLLEKLNKTIVFHCETHYCETAPALKTASEISQKYLKDDLVILMHGGGNIVGYAFEDRIRRKYIEAFPERQCILFSQSIWLHEGYSSNLEFARETYSNRSNLVILLRDQQSLEIAKNNFRGIKLILAPDLAFCIGMIPRQMPPLYDIVWLRREDNEKSSFTFPKIPKNITFDVGEWLKWRTNTGRQTMETVFLVTAEGFQFLQRGRIVVTERLHGHILSTLLNIPHVIIDNPPYLKLSSFHKTWTQGLSNTILVSNGSQALDAALELLRRYENSLPSLGYRDMLAVT